MAISARLRCTSGSYACTEGAVISPALRKPVQAGQSILLVKQTGGGGGGGGFSFSSTSIVMGKRGLGLALECASSRFIPVSTYSRCGIS